MIASPCRISPLPTVSESHCPWYGCSAFGTSLILSGHPAMIMSARVLQWVILDCELVISFLLSINVYVVDRDVYENLWCILR